MFTSADKAWVAGAVAWLGQTLAVKFGLGGIITPELVALVAGAATWWVRNKATP